MKNRFVNEHKMLIRFADQILVQCPKCSGLAKVIIPQNAVGYADPYVWDRLSRRVLCTKCSFMKEVHPRRGPHNDWKFDFTLSKGSSAVDWFYGLPLYLQTPFRGHILWAFNFNHLNYLERYIRAEIRESAPYYLSIESTLPKWIKLSKNRDNLLKAISKIKSSFHNNS